MPIKDHGCILNGIFILLPFGTCYGGLPIEITVACIMHTNGKRHLIRILSVFYESEQFCCNWWCDSSLCFCSQDETQHLPPHGGPVHERGEEEEERTGIHSLCRSAEDGARTQIEVDQVGGVKTYRHPDHNLVLWIWCSKDSWSWIRYRTKINTYSIHFRYCIKKIRKPSPMATKRHCCLLILLTVYPEQLTTAYRPISEWLTLQLKAL